MVTGTSHTVVWPHRCGYIRALVEGKWREASRIDQKRTKGGFLWWWSIFFWIFSSWFDNVNCYRTVTCYRQPPSHRHCLGLPPCFLSQKGSNLSSSLMGSLGKGLLQKVCGNSAENSRKFAENTFYCVRKGCGDSAEISRKFAEHSLQWPLPERPHKWIAEKLWKSQ